MKRVFPHTHTHTHTCARARTHTHARARARVYGALRPKKQLSTELMINQCAFPVRYELMLKKRLNFKHIMQLSTNFSTSLGETNIDKSKKNPSELTQHHQTTTHSGLRQSWFLVTSDFFIC